MELETMIAGLMTIVAITPFIAIMLSKVNETRKYKNIYNYNIKN
jgi:hypothetical protein